MKHRIMFLAAGMFFGAYCGAAEAVPEFMTLTIRDGRASGANFESARTPVVRTALRGDVLDVEISVEFPPGDGKLDFAIPPEAKKIRIFGCDYDLPPAGHAACFHAFPMAESRKRISRDEMLRAMLLIAYAPDGKSFGAQLWYCGKFGGETWTNKRNFSCLVADDGRIFEKLSPEDRARYGPGTVFEESGVFQNRDGKTAVRLTATGNDYIHFVDKEFVWQDVLLPTPDPHPATQFFLNLPFKERYLAENQTGNFEFRRGVAEFRALAEKLRSLRMKMTPDETARLLGEPDRYGIHGAKGPNLKTHAYAQYDFLRATETSMKNLSVTLHFEKAPDGVFRLKDVF